MEVRMKKALFLMMVALLVVTIAAPAATVSNDDNYRVIQQAVKKEKAADSSLTWLRIEVVDKKENKKKVTIRLPFSLVEIFMNCSSDHLKIDGDHDIDWARVINELKKSGGGTLIEVDEDDEYVRIWIE